MEDTASLSNGSTEYARADRGRFATGTRAGPGRPPLHPRFRDVLWAEIKREDIACAIQTLRDVMADAKAKPSERIAAAREILDRAAGRPLPSDLSDIVHETEELAAQAREEGEAS